MSKVSTSRFWWAQILGGHSDARLVSSSDSASERYVLLPNRNHATIVIDASLSQSIASAVGRAGQGKARALAGRLLKVPGATAMIRSKLTLQSPEATLRLHLSEVLESECWLSCTSGPLRPNRKPVVRAVDGSGNILSVAKLGWDDLTAQLVKTEGEALHRVHRCEFDSIVVPETIVRHDWRSNELLVVSALPIDERVVPSGDPEPTMASLAEVSSLDRATVSSITETSFWERIVTRVNDVARFDQFVDVSAELDIGGSHGDWSPWNTQALPDGRLLVWDWERYATDVPVGLDVVHFLFQVERFIEKRNPAMARPRVIDQARLLLPKLDVSPDLASHLTDLYLIEALARNDESSLAGQLSKRRESLLEALIGSATTVRKAA